MLQSGVLPGTGEQPFAGEILPAKSLVPLAAGDALRVQVMRAAAGELRLRVLGRAGGAVAGDHLAEVLRGQGVPPGEEALRAARGLILAGQPVTAARVRAVMAALRADPGAAAAPDETAQAAALLLGRGLPPLPPLLAALRFHAWGALPFGTQAAALDAALAALPAGLPSDAPGGQAGRNPPPATAAAGSQPREGGGANGAGAGGALRGLAGALRGVLNDLTLRAAPPSAAGGGERGGAKEGPAVAAAAPPAPGALAARLGGALRALGMDWEREWVRRLTGPERGEVPAPGAPGNLKGLLLALRHVLRAAMGEPDQAGHQDGGPASAAYRQALVRAEEALQTITAWQALSVEPEEEGAPARQTLVFQLPVDYGAVAGTLEVVVEKAPRRRGGAEDQGAADGGAGGQGGWHAVRLCLAPPCLGEVRVDLFLQDRRLQVGIAAREEPSRAALEEGGEGLAERLRGQGFRVEGIGFRPLADGGAGAPWDAGDPWGAPPPAGIDLVL